MKILNNLWRDIIDNKYIISKRESKSRYFPLVFRNDSRALISCRTRP